MATEDIWYGIYPSFLDVHMDVMLSQIAFAENGSSVQTFLSFKIQVKSVRLSCCSYILVPGSLI